MQASADDHEAAALPRHVASPTLAEPKMAVDRSSSLVSCSMIVEGDLMMSVPIAAAMEEAGPATAPLAAAAKGSPLPRGAGCGAAAAMVLAQGQDLRHKAIRPCQVRFEAVGEGADRDRCCLPLLNCRFAASCSGFGGDAWWRSCTWVGLRLLIRAVAQCKGWWRAVRLDVQCKKLVHVKERERNFKR